MQRSRVAGLGLALLVSGESLAASCRGELELGERAYRALEFERCVKHLERAERTLTSGPDIVERELYLGLCEAALNHVRQATDHFQAALDLDPSVRPPADSSPKVGALFEMLLAKQSKPVAKPAPLPASAPAAVVPAPQPAWVAPQAVTPTTQVTARRSSGVPDWLPWTLGGLTVAGAGVFTGFGLSATKQASLANASGTFADDTVRYGSGARRDATVANVGLGVGAVALGGLVVVLVYRGVRSASP